MKVSEMQKGNWQTTVLSDVGYDHLVAEVSLNDQFVLLLDRELGRDAVCVAFPGRDGKLTLSVSLTEFIDQLQAAAADLCR